jgi:hypothetical protein
MTRVEMLRTLNSTSLGLLTKGEKRELPSADAIALIHLGYAQLVDPLTAELDEPVDD